MHKIWAKLIVDQRIIKNKIVDIDYPYHSSRLYDMIVQVCYELDIPTPMVLHSHKFNYTNFNTAKFVQSDFVEEIEFDTLTLENASAQLDKS